MMQENSYWKVDRLLADRAAKNGEPRGADVKNGEITVPGAPAACANESPSVAKVEAQASPSKPSEGPPASDPP